MDVKVFFSRSEYSVSDFEMQLRLLDKVLNAYLQLSPFNELQFDIYKECSCCETQKEKACNKSVCKQRRNKTVNVSKSS